MDILQWMVAIRMRVQTNKNENLLNISSSSGLPRCRWVCSQEEETNSSSGLPRCRWVGFFFLGTDLENGLMNQWILCSEWVSTEWESKQLIKNITIILLIKQFHGLCICFLQTHSFSLHNMLTDGLEWCGLLWCFYQLFGLSFWRHPFTAEDPLVSKWCNATFLQIWWRNKLIYILYGLMVRSFFWELPFFVFFHWSSFTHPHIVPNWDSLFFLELSSFKMPKKHHKGSLFNSKCLLNLKKTIKFKLFMCCYIFLINHSSQNYSECFVCNLVHDSLTHWFSR